MNTEVKSEIFLKNWNHIAFLYCWMHILKISTHDAPTFLLISHTWFCCYLKTSHTYSIQIIYNTRKTYFSLQVYTKNILHKITVHLNYAQYKQGFGILSHLCCKKTLALHLLIENVFGKCFMYVFFMPICFDVWYWNKVWYEFHME